MKSPSSKTQRTTANARAAKILKSLRDARKQAVETARQHGTSIVYLKDGKLVKERP